nr:copper-binding protein [uncultured Polynucleobacter sp.]
MKNLFAISLLLFGFSSFAEEWIKGEIRRIDVDNKKITIKHEEMKTLDMPPMSMVFYVENSGLLKGIKPGDQIEFIADQKGTKIFVKQIRSLQ